MNPIDDTVRGRASHASVELCASCQQPVTTRQARGIDRDTITLDTHPHPDGTWIVRADLTVTRAAGPHVQAYREHRCARGTIVPLRAPNTTQHDANAPTRPRRPIEATWPEYGRIEGTNAEVYANAGEDGDVLVTIDTQTGLDGVRRTVIDTELDREAAARAILQLVIAYGVDERMLETFRRHGDEAMMAACEEWGW